MKNVDLEKSHSSFIKHLDLVIEMSAGKLSLAMGLCRLVAIAGTIILVPWHVIKSLQLILKSGTRKWNLRAPDLQVSYKDLT